MKKQIQGIIGFGLIMGCLFGVGPAGAQTLAALPSPTASAATGNEARPVLGWVKFCERHPRECEIDTTEPATITLTSRIWQTVISTNRRVNGAIKATTDQDHWGVPDSWDIPTDGMGDCEDYQLLKRKLLADAGLPRRAMRITVVIDDKGEGHAVLMVRTDRGDFILDNKINSVLPWHQTGYIYVKREGQNGAAWVSLGGATSPVVTANR
jgi:predicted transglutaminase-like cysteine proteinase